MPNVVDKYSQAIDAVGRLVKSGTKDAGEEALRLIRELQTIAQPGARAMLDRAEAAVQKTLESGALFVANSAASALYDAMTLAGRTPDPPRATPAPPAKPKAPKAKTPKKGRRKKRDKR